MDHSEEDSVEAEKNDREGSVKSQRPETLCCVPGNASSYLLLDCKVLEGDGEMVLWLEKEAGARS